MPATLFLQSFALMFSLAPVLKQLCSCSSSNCTLYTVILMVTVLELCSLTRAGIWQWIHVRLCGYNTLAYEWVLLKVKC